MALQTYTFAYWGEQFANNKSMLALLNGVGSGVVAKVWRVLLLNSSLTTVTGVIAAISLRPLSGLSAGTAVTAIKHDSNNANVPAQVVCSRGGTATEVGTTLRRIAWSTDEPAVSSATSDELQNLVPLNYIWDAGYGDANVQPLTLREGEGISVKCETSTTAGYLDVAFEVTLE
jgi:hypothetical protein